MSVTLEDVEKLVRVQLGVPRVSGSDRLMEDLGAESADLVNLIASAEDRFGITFDEEEIAGVRTVVQLYELVEKILQ